MTVPATIDHDIERALLVPIWTAMQTAGAPYVQPDGAPSIQLPNEPLDTAPLDRYVRWGFYPAPPIVREMGPTPAMTRKGFIRLDTYVRLGIGKDQTDAFAAMVRGAYPYATTLTRNGTSVIIDVVEEGLSSEQPSWFVTNLNVNFDVWR